MAVNINSPQGFVLRGGRKIPENRVVHIYGADDKDIVDVPLFYDGEFSLKASSTFGSLWDAEGNNLLTLLSGATNGALPSGQFALQGAQIWQSTNPLTLDLTLYLYMNDSGKNDVMSPALTLVSTCLPTKTDFFQMKIGNTNIKLQTLIPPGPNLQALIAASGAVTGNNLLDNFSKGSRGVYTLKLGQHITIPRIIITSVEPTFSKWTDEDGYPISAEIALSFTTMEIATTDMIARIWRVDNSAGA